MHVLAVACCHATLVLLHCVALYCCVVTCFVVLCLAWQPPHTYLPCFTVPCCVVLSWHLLHHCTHNAFDILVLAVQMPASS
jgi:hypothetical protein